MNKSLKPLSQCLIEWSETFSLKFKYCRDDNKSTSLFIVSSKKLVS